MAATFQESVSVRDASNQLMLSQNVLWTSLNPLVATVNPQGLIAAAGAGTAVVVASAGTIQKAITVTVTPV